MSQRRRHPLGESEELLLRLCFCEKDHCRGGNSVLCGIEADSHNILEHYVHSILVS